MKIVNLGSANSVLNRFVAQMRDISVQKDSMRFRANMERSGEIFAYEISKTLSYEEKQVETPLGIATTRIPSDKMVLGMIFRAGLPFHRGFLNFFDDAENAFIAAYRKYGKDNECKIHLEYTSCPSLEDKTLILADPMIATGASMYLAYKSLMEKGEPRHIHFASIVASAEAVEYLSKMLPHKNVTLWVAAIDEELTNKSYIVPGLGDAGDLAFGKKI
ncbi:MAG: uracil phosphoribosyltransferase [Bacteroidales bacterium]|nr:uracil phosphoribosyltransferase [Candidatus Cacconaster caballi]